MNIKELTSKLIDAHIECNQEKINSLSTELAKIVDDTNFRELRESYGYRPIKKKEKIKNEFRKK